MANSQVSSDSTPLELLTFADLRSFGITISRIQVRRLVRAGRFPAPVEMSPGGRIYWRRSDIEQWLLNLKPAKSALRAREQAARAQQDTQVI
jgi:predicted DNA-binding transcriptional regulator AlpA